MKTLARMIAAWAVACLVGLVPGAIPPATAQIVNQAVNCTPSTGTGGCVGQTSPTLTTPILGDATATSLTSSGTVQASNGLLGVAAFSFAPFYIGVHNVTVLTAASPADIATLTVPAGITRWRSCGASSTLDPFVSIIPRTFTATMGAATFTAFDTAGGAGNQMSVSNFGGPTTSSGGQVVGGAAGNNQYSATNSVVIRQTANSANAGTVDFYVKICPMP